MLSNEPIRIVVVFLFLLKVWLCFLIANKNLFVVTIKVWLKLPENKHVRFADIAPTRICVLIVLMKTLSSAQVSQTQPIKSFCRHSSNQNAFLTFVLYEGLGVAL